MKKIVHLIIPILLFLFGGISITNAVAKNKGYIITIDNKKITGEVQKIFYSDMVSEVVFTNDFGNTYNFKAGLILGFVYTDADGILNTYESKRYRNRWFYLNLAFKGDILKYYKSPQMKSIPGNAFSGYAAIKNIVDESWLEYEGKTYRILPTNWRKKLKKIFHKKSNVVKELENRKWILGNLDDLLITVDNLLKARSI